MIMRKHHFHKNVFLERELHARTLRYGVYFSVDLIFGILNHAENINDVEKLRRAMFNALGLNNIKLHWSKEVSYSKNIYS